MAKYRTIRPANEEIFSLRTDGSIWDAPLCPGCLAATLKEMVPFLLFARGASPKPRGVMRILLGIESKEGAEEALRRLQDLQFADVELHLANVIEEWGTLAWEKKAPGPQDFAGRYIERQEVNARLLLDHAGHYARELGLAHTQTHLSMGFPANAILHLATQLRSDLIILGPTSPHSSVDSVLMGEVARKVALQAKHSILLFKGHKTLDSQVAVIATDHSAYLNDSLQEFMRFAPRGLKHLHIVTACSPVMIEKTKGALAPTAGDSLDWLGLALKEENEKLAHRLTAESCGWNITSSVGYGSPAKIIAQSMARLRAGLLILGAQGQGSLVGASCGSTAIHIAISEPFSTLILRKP